MRICIHINMKILIAGCSKCLKTFPRLTLNNGKMKGNFSGFDRASWQPRDGRDHKLGAHRTKSAKSEAERKRMEATGTRWSALFALQYHNPVIHHTGIVRKLRYVPNLVSAGENSYEFYLPKLWNHLPIDLRNIESFNSFKHDLKTY